MKNFTPIDETPITLPQLNFMAQLLKRMGNNREEMVEIIHETFDVEDVGDLTKDEGITAIEMIKDLLEKKI